MTLGFIQGIGLLELVIVLAILLLVLGPKRLPGLARSAGAGLRELRSAVTSRHDAEPDAREGESAPARAALGRPDEASVAASAPEAVRESR